MGGVMYKEHPLFIQPHNEQSLVWRYMSFTKLVSLLESQCLFFSRADLLGDPFEGSWPKMSLTQGFDIFADEIPEKARPAVKLKLQQMRKSWPKYVALNCWHMNEWESAAMWNIYLKSNEGVAIRSTYKRLRESLIDDQDVYLGKVKYINYQTDYIDVDNILTPFLHKRKSFEHEKEVRGLVTKVPISEKEIDYKKETITNGLRIRVNMETLVERIYVAPNCPEWFEQVVRSVVSKYGYKFEIKHSALDDVPIF
jgi:hypothetical protein